MWHSFWSPNNLIDQIYIYCVLLMFQESDRLCSEKPAPLVSQWLSQVSQNADSISEPPFASQPALKEKTEMVLGRWPWWELRNALTGLAVTDSPSFGRYANLSVGVIALSLYICKLKCTEIDQLALSHLIIKHLGHSSCPTNICWMNE